MKSTDAHTLSGTYSDESILRAVSDEIMNEIHVLNEDERMREIGQQAPHIKPVMIGVFAEYHYVNLEPSNSKNFYCVNIRTSLCDQY